MKKIYLVLCLVLIMLGATACGKADDTKPADFDEATLSSSAQSLAETLATEESLSQIANEDVYADFSSNYGEDIAISYKTFYDTTKDLSGYKNTTVTDTIISGDTASVELNLVYSDETVVMICNFDKKGQLTNFSSEIYRTLGQKMLKALLNTVMGMGTVFVVLIFISFIINLLKYVPKLLLREKKADPIILTDTKDFPEEEELIHDSELVAVITAAIMASYGDRTPEDGLVVRSIRKTNKKWKNA